MRSWHGGKGSINIGTTLQEKYDAVFPFKCQYKQGTLCTKIGEGTETRYGKQCYYSAGLYITANLCKERNN